ncbi:serine/threonine protein kinase [Pseudenhygromyxa sp. WMMC2535]|uniref:protein kinase domain-containing protein n=1 Tax=Pseudenhygromyxa sp. WMMC2535 TaxID=2712867 RepID=UPI001557CAAF|nr:serine/threonine protein kinase [Pseudenhygromyxa sp. WMMC2535]
MQRLGNYTLSRRLGVGGMGEVWMGQREALGGAAKKVAIKVLSADKGRDPMARRMFLDEARLSMLLHSSNIVQVFDADEAEDSTCYMVMEWVDGLNLSELCAKLRESGEQLSDTMSAFVIGEVLKGLAYAHELHVEGEIRTIVHRDISPQNVMISRSGEVKIMDFGIARLASEDTSGIHVKGKLRYMPPEQLRGETREPTLDLFAVGAMLHELLDNQKFRGGVVDEGRLFGVIFEGQIPPMTRDPKTIPYELDELRKDLLAPDPSQRVQRARDAFRRLAGWSGYRDVRFELDELMRRYLGSSASMSVPVVPRAALGDVEIGKSDPDVMRGASASVSASVSSASSSGRIDDSEATELIREASDTDVGRLQASPPAVAVPRASGGGDRRRLVVVGVASLGVLLTLAGVMTLIGRTSEEPGADDEVAQGAAEVSVLAPAPSEPEPEPEKGTVAGAAAPGEVAPEVPALDASADTGTDTADPVADPVEEVVEEAVEPAVAKQPTKGRRKKPAVSKSKVSVSLGSGVTWAEVKIGGRTIELDAFESKQASTHLAPGRYSASYRTKVGSSMKSAGRVTIPDEKASIVVSKTGLVVK